MAKGLPYPVAEFSHIYPVRKNSCLQETNRFCGREQYDTICAKSCFSISGYQCHHLRGLMDTYHPVGYTLLSRRNVGTLRSSREAFPQPGAL